MEKAIFAAGCFWGVEESFRNVPGVTKTTVGYTGGRTVQPNYEQVCHGDTGHAEAVEVEFDPAQVSYGQLLQLFWASHDPTTPNRQGPDFGEQYRSAIFWLTPEQESQALESKTQLDASKKFKNPVVTQVAKAIEFFPAEEYHQQYLAKRGAKVCH